LLFTFIYLKLQRIYKGGDSVHGKEKEKEEEEIVGK
jgi:hypothetical protein